MSVMGTRAEPSPSNDLRFQGSRAPRIVCPDGDAVTRGGGRENRRKRPCLTERVKVPATVSYSVLRLALFGATLALSAALLRGTSFLVVLAVATLLSGVLSYFLLARSREQMARVVAGRVSRLNARLDAGAAAEDEALDEVERAVEQDRHAPERAQHNPE
jgi:hypothetical protein